jgi:succinyl-CoA synthetase beta subunit
MMPRNVEMTELPFIRIDIETQKQEEISREDLNAKLKGYYRNTEEIIGMMENGQMASVRTMFAIYIPNKKPACFGCFGYATCDLRKGNTCFWKERCKNSQVEH